MITMAISDFVGIYGAMDMDWLGLGFILSIGMAF